MPGARVQQATRHRMVEAGKRTGRKQGGCGTGGVPQSRHAMIQAMRNLCPCGVLAVKGHPASHHRQCFLESRQCFGVAPLSPLPESRLEPGRAHPGGTEVNSGNPLSSVGRVPSRNPMTWASVGSAGAGKMRGRRPVPGTRLRLFPWCCHRAMSNGTTVRSGEVPA